MFVRLVLTLATCAVGSTAFAALPEPLVTGMKNPESVVIGLDGRTYITVIGEFDKDGDGSVVVVDQGKVVPFTSNLDDPKGIVLFGEFLYVADKKKVLKIDKQGKSTVLAGPEAFPIPPLFLNDLAVDEKGVIYASDSGDLKGKGGAIFRINPNGKVALVANEKTTDVFNTPNGLLNDSLHHIFLADFGSGELHRVDIATGKTEKIADKLGNADGLIFDKFGRLYISDYKGGKIFVIPRPGVKPILLAEGFKTAADICLSADGKSLLVPDMSGGTLTALPLQVPGYEVDASPLPIETTLAFPDVVWEGWKGEDNAGKPVPLRPIVLTHAGDGSNRVFVATQQGVIHVLPNDQKAVKAPVFMDIQSRVMYIDKENEQGLLGLAFHPKFKENGEFFVFYTVKTPKLTNVISRFRVSKTDPTKADPASEEEIFRIDHKYWNHNGGTVCFGPDGYLYIALGDGGDGGDPDDNGQNLTNLLGKILRIDVDSKADGKKYGIPKDNPFVGQEKAQPEIYAYGLRNPWRMSFDRKTGQLWLADVGQNLWEEINLITKGGNYGWARREGLHPFGAKGTGPKKDYIEPIWEYHHSVGKSITGGHVYRGKEFPELAGAYLYADYVSAKIWALTYDEKKDRVVTNRLIRDPNVPVLSFGEDETGEVYFMTFSATGKGIYRFARSATK